MTAAEVKARAAAERHLVNRVQQVLAVEGYVDDVLIARVFDLARLGVDAMEREETRQ